ncbi:MAG: hypothetical protein AAF658_19165, partial [Myxococcota bacterium]
MNLQDRLRPFGYDMRDRRSRDGLLGRGSQQAYETAQRFAVVFDGEVEDRSAALDVLGIPRDSVEGLSGRQIVARHLDALARFMVETDSSVSSVQDLPGYDAGPAALSGLRQFAAALNARAASRASEIAGEFETNYPSANGRIRPEDITTLDTFRDRNAAMGALAAASASLISAWGDPTVQIEPLVDAVLDAESKTLPSHVEVMRTEFDSAGIPIEALAGEGRSDALAARMLSLGAVSRAGDAHEDAPEPRPEAAEESDVAPDPMDVGVENTAAKPSDALPTLHEVLALGDPAQLDAHLATLSDSKWVRAFRERESLEAVLTLDGAGQTLGRIARHAVEQAGESSYAQQQAGILIGMAVWMMRDDPDGRKRFADALNDSDAVSSLELFDYGTIRSTRAEGEPVSWLVDYLDPSRVDDGEPSLENMIRTRHPETFETSRFIELFREL